MNLVSLFRVLIVISSISYFLYFFLPYFPSVYFGHEGSVVFDSAALISTDRWLFIFNFLFALWVIASIGMIFFQNWGRFLFLVLTLISFAFNLALDVSATIPIEFFLLNLIATLDGGIIAMAFLSPISTCFEKADSSSFRSDA